MTNTQRSKARIARIAALRAVDPNHPTVLHEKARRRAGHLRRQNRLKELAAIDPNHPRLLKLKATGAKIQRNCRTRNPEKHKAALRKYHHKNKARLNKARRSRVLAVLELEKNDPLNPKVLAYRESMRKGSRTYAAKHPNRIINHSPEAIERRRVRRNLGCRILNELRKYRSGKAVKTDKLIRLLGCSIPSFMIYIESLWEPWMNWSNYGNQEGNWVLDHYIPCAAFDLSLAIHQQYCFHYSNYKPLEKARNMAKFDKLPAGFNLSEHLSKPLSPTPALGTEPQPLVGGIDKQPCVSLIADLTP